MDPDRFERPAMQLLEETRALRQETREFHQEMDTVRGPRLVFALGASAAPT